MENKMKNGTKNNLSRALITVFILAVILVAGGYFRFLNVNWDESYHLHPDERYLSMVLNSMQPVDSVSEYFDTQNSSLNPNTHGYTFFVYGTFPLFIIRYVGEIIGQTGYDPITLVGRTLSAIFDLLTVVLVFLIAFKLYNERVGLIAAALYAFAVLPIQQSHFMTVDTFTNTFGMLTVLAAVIILKKPHLPRDDGQSKSFKRLWQMLWPYLFFGLALGMATASKINAVSLAVLLPLVEVVRYFQTENREENVNLTSVILLVLLAAVMSFLTFRLLQPYAFEGPGFISFSLNPDWWNGMQSLRMQSTGNVDFPPALQWARRPASFSITNLLVWGVGLAWGISSVFAWIGMAWQSIKGREWSNLPLLIWSLLYFIWQGLAWVSAMRYLLLLYPVMAIVTAWAFDRLIQNESGFRIKNFKISQKVVRTFGFILSAVVLLGSAAWAFAFTRIYSRPVTRLQATDWIYENIEGPINLVFEKDGVESSFPIQYRANHVLNSDESYVSLYQAKADGKLIDLTYPTIQNLSPTDSLKFELRIIDAENGELFGGNPFSVGTSIDNDGIKLPVLTLQFMPELALEAGKLYRFELKLLSPEARAHLSGVPEMNFVYEDGSVRQEELPRITEEITNEHAYNMRATVQPLGEMRRVEIPWLVDASQTDSIKQLQLTLSLNKPEGPELRIATVAGSFLGAGDADGSRLVFDLDQPIEVNEITEFELSLAMPEGEGQIAIKQGGIALESSWDDGLPLSRASLQPYSNEAGIYRPDLNFEMYWPDDESKVQRFYSILNQTDTIVMSSNRQFGTIPRVPERYPLSTTFYRELLACQEGQDTLDCYYQAKGGEKGNLGFDLAAVFTSYPNLGSLEFNDQYAEEAFSVYDHPKVLVFRKNADYDSNKVWETLNSVDVSKAIFLTPKQADDYKADDANKENLLLLDETELEVQQAGGTWSELFNRESLLNKHPWLAVAAFYLLFLVLGLIVFPIVRLALHGLKDRGYGFARIIGLLIFVLIAFNLGSMKVAVSRGLLWLVLAGILLVSGITAWFTREGLKEDFKEHWKQFLIEEVVFLVAFAFFLWIRYQNPDLWHPWRGGEKPMDFSYLNAVIKSETFPAYDPWFAGGYINYYYYGQVLVGLPIKLLGIVPAVSYNILLSIWYAMVVLATFSIAWNIGKAVFEKSSEDKGKVFGPAFWAGIASAIFLALLGNLGEITVIANGLKLLGASGASLDGASFAQNLSWFFKGIGLSLQGNALPIGAGTWYWNPSRMIPGEPITEFPFFTFLYADFHAHLIAMPIVLASVGWCLSLIMAKKTEAKDWFKKIALPVLLTGAVILGALAPTNTWDSITFTALAIVSLLYVGFRYFPEAEWRFLPKWMRKIVYPLFSAGLLLVFSRLFYYNFNRYFMSGYSAIGYWDGVRTPLPSYLMHWGLILFVLACWMIWEIYQWMAKTRLSDLDGLKKHKNWLFAILGFVVIALIGMLILKISVAIVAIPLAVMALFLVLSTDDDAKRLAFFMIGTGLVLTLVVELVYLKGDIGRMNVVFKLYHQAWMLLTLPLGVAAVTLWRDLPEWKTGKRVVFHAVFSILVFSALLFPVLAGKDKMTDRMDRDAVHTLDGMKYMETSWYTANNQLMDLSQDYRAIQWMQDNVEGSPVILEGQAYEYYWGNRYTIYTGLPGVVGWNYHQRQQRAILGNNDVQNRVDEVNAFYNSQDPNFVSEFLAKYKVSYIVVGQQEKAFYSPEGLAKFEEFDGILWEKVYNEADTTIYKVK